MIKRRSKKFQNINNIFEGFIRVGQVLAVPNDGSAAVSQHQINAYTVRAGDSLWSIADRSGTTGAALTSVNGLDQSGVIHPGDVLTIPSRTSPSQTNVPANQSSSGTQTLQLNQGPKFHSES